MNKFGAAFGVIIGLCLIGTGVYGAINHETVDLNDEMNEQINSQTNEQINSQTNEQGNSQTNLTTNKTLTCVATEYDEVYGTDCMETATINYVNGEASSIGISMVYQYDDVTTYQQMFKSMEKSGQSDFNGTLTNWNLDDENLKYEINISGDLSTMLSSGWTQSENAPTDMTYDGLKLYYTNLGFNCK